MINVRLPGGLLLGLLIVGGVWIGTGEESDLGMLGASDPANSFTQPARIYVDGRMTEWDSLTIHHNDLGDGDGMASTASGPLTVNGISFSASNSSGL